MGLDRHDSCCETTDVSNPAPNQGPMHQPHFSTSREPLVVHPQAMLVVIDRHAKHGQILSGAADGSKPFDHMLNEAKQRFAAQPNNRFMIVWANANPGARWYTIGDSVPAFKHLLCSVVQDVIDMGQDVMRVLMVDEPMVKELDTMIWEVVSSYPKTKKRTLH